MLYDGHMYEHKEIKASKRIDKDTLSQNMQMKFICN